MDDGKKWVVVVILLLVISASAFFGIPRLSRYSAVDEPYWTYDRTPSFWNSIKEKKWKGTKINDKPGITTAIISGAGLLFIDPMPYKSYRQKVKDADQESAIKKINFYFRLPIFIFDLLMLLVFYVLIKKLLNQFIALCSVVFIGLSPIILGISLIINPDSLLWAFLPLSILSYLVFQKENQKKYLLLAGLFLGLSLLTKYVANILYIYFFGLIFLDFIFRQNEKSEVQKYFIRSFISYFALLAVSCAVYFAFFPATWINPKLVLKGTVLSKAFESTWPFFVAIWVIVIIGLFIKKGQIISWALNYICRYKKIFLKITTFLFIFSVFLVFLNVYSNMRLWNFESILASPKSSAKAVFNAGIFMGRIMADFYSLIFGLTPLVFIFFMFALIRNFFFKDREENKIPIVFYFLVFIFLYYLASTVNHVSATVRYQIITYPLACIISAIGLHQFLNADAVKKHIKKFPDLFAYLLLICISLASLLCIKPFYFSYASSLLPKKYILNFKDMGDGSFEIAQYFNSLPNSRELVIWSDKGAVCESFVGRCYISYSRKDVENIDFDYFATSLGRKSKSMKMSTVLKGKYDFKKLYSADIYDYKIVMGGRNNNFVKAIAGEKAVLDNQ